MACVVEINQLQEMKPQRIGRIVSVASVSMTTTKCAHRLQLHQSFSYISYNLFPEKKLTSESSHKATKDIFHCLFLFIDLYFHCIDFFHNTSFSLVSLLSHKQRLHLLRLVVFVPFQPLYKVIYQHRPSTYTHQSAAFYQPVHRKHTIFVIV